MRKQQAAHLLELSFWEHACARDLQRMCAASSAQQTQKRRRTKQQKQQQKQHLPGTATQARQRQLQPMEILKAPHRHPSVQLQFQLSSSLMALHVGVVFARCWFCPRHAF